MARSYGGLSFAAAPRAVSSAGRSYGTQAEAQIRINSKTIKDLLPQARAPETVAKIDTPTNNSDMSPLFRRHLLVKASESERMALPADLEFIRPVVEKAFEHEKKIQGDNFNAERCFLTVRRSVVSYDAKNQQTDVQENVRDLWHYDGANPPEDSRVDSIYSYCDWKMEGFPKTFKEDKALSTQFYTGSLPKLPETANLKEDMALYLQLAPKDDKLIMSPDKGELVHWSGLHPHRSPFLANDQLFKDAGVEKGQIARIFVRVTFAEGKNFTDSNNCHVNIDLFPKAYASVMSPDRLQSLGNRELLNARLSEPLKNFGAFENGLVMVKRESDQLRLNVALSDTLKMQSQPLSKSESAQVAKALDPAAALKWTLVNSVTNQFSDAPLDHFKGQFTTDQFRKAWEVGMTYGPVREKILSMARQQQLFAPDVSLDNIKASFDHDIANSRSGAERTRRFMEKNEFLAVMHPSPLQETVNLWRTSSADLERRAQIQTLIDEAIQDPVNPFAKVSELRSKLIVNSGEDLLDKSMATNDFVDLLGDRKTLARYLYAVLSHKGSFKDLVKANQERSTHSIYGHAQLRVTEDLQTVLGVWVPLNLDKSIKTAGDPVPFDEFNNNNLTKNKDFIAIEPPHNHHFDFSSKVVMGEFFQATYEVVSRQEKVQTSKRIYDEEGRHWHLKMHKVGWAWPDHDDAGVVKDLRGNGTVTMGEGDVYYCYKSVIHSPVLSTQGEAAISLHSHAYEHGTTPYFYMPESMYKFHTEQQDAISKGKTQIETEAIRGLFRGVQQLLENPHSEKSSAKNWLNTYNKFMQAPDFNLLQK